MAFLIINDLRTVLRNDGVDNLTKEDDTIANTAISTATKYVESKIARRYDPDQIFKNIVPYADATTYDNVANYTTYASDTDYVIGNQVSYYGFVYTAVANSRSQYPAKSETIQDFNGNDITTIVVNTDYWTKESFDTQIYYTEDAYAAATAYVVDDRVSYGSGDIKTIYICIQSGTGKTPDTETAYWTPISIGGVNVLNYDYFYAIQETQGNKPEDTTYWTKGDIRDPLILEYTSIYAAFVLYKLNPRATAEVVMEAKDEAIKHLNRIADGRDDYRDLPTYIDITRGTIYHSDGVDKQDWEY
jgi:hypothetical protein